LLVYKYASVSPP